MCFELSYLLKDEVGDSNPRVSKTGIRGLIVAKTSLSPYYVIKELRAIIREHPYKFRYALRIIPVERVVPTDLEEIKSAASKFAAKIKENETFRVTVEKRFTDLHSKNFIEASATAIQRKVNLENPDKILLIEVIGGLTGMALITPNDVLAVLKEKML